MRRTKPERILSVEDDPDIQAVVRLSLETIGGFDTAICTSGEQAIAMIDDFKPDLILLDVMMPELDGPATFRALRRLESARDIPVIFMTARVMQNEIDRLQGLGALGVIAKPFDPMKLPGLLLEIWEGGDPDSP